MPGKSDRPLLWLSKYLSLALTLPASVFAGYILSVIAGHWFHSPLLPLAGILLGIFAGVFQIVRELTRETKADRRR